MSHSFSVIWMHESFNNYILAWVPFSVFSEAQDGRAGRVQIHTSDRWWCCRVTATGRNREPTVSAQPFYLHRIHLGIFCVFLLVTNPMKVPDLHWIFLQRCTVCLQLILLCHSEPQCCTESHPSLPWLPHTYTILLPQILTGTPNESATTLAG